MLKPRHTDDSIVEVGIDEAGRGCLWGPLVAAAVIWPDESSWSDPIKTTSAQIKDSKTITAKNRCSIEQRIKEYAIEWSVGIVTAAEIDTIGMTRANRLAFERALNGLTHPVGRILIDGTIGISPRAGIEQIVEPRGDGTYISIAAASIIAKEARDTIVKDLCRNEPSLQEHYSILNSKGYGTAKHREGIKNHGMHILHRKLFLRKLLGLDHIVSEEYSFIDD